ncbi:hypothetical protein O181_003297 [Austropuccinia psidii MF-1]|uniref:CCHC-type domain-containing protein n=1 Tax=Austropuccinia psidii MF-1 TaxID=1389203 RepID=A0A9Q3BE48_9BASI|nr:hypothetical protein [Austropuccinia psidii MF-1]
MKLDCTTRNSSPFINCFTDLRQPSTSTPKFRSSPSAGDACRPPEHLLDLFGAQCFYCGDVGHWRFDCPRRRRSSTGSRPATPHNVCPKTPDFLPPTPSAVETLRAFGGRVSQVSFVKENSSKNVLADSGVSTDLSGAPNFVTSKMTIRPFDIFLADYETTIKLSQIVKLKITVAEGWLFIPNVPFSDKISGTILLLGQLV